MCLIGSLILTITLIICLSALLIVALIHDNKYSIDDFIVYVESDGEYSKKTGMGFVYKIDGGYNYIITNYHVVESNDYLYVYNFKNDGTSAKIIYYDIYTDIAVLKIKDCLRLKAAKIDNKDFKENDKIYYYNIFKKTIDNGSIISFDNEINISSSYGNSFYNAVSIKASVESGNSGSPVFNKLNEVIGMISLKDEDTNSGFYIPIKNVIDIVTKLENHTLVRPNLGAKFINVTNHDLLNEYGINTELSNGVVILDVVSEYPLSKSGLNNGDIIISIDGVQINNVIELQKQIYSHKIGDKINLEYYSSGNLNSAIIILEK